MLDRVRQRILDLTGAHSVGASVLIQPLWNGYGTLSRVHLEGGTHSSVIVKRIAIPDHLVHPRGFANTVSRDRKVRSYRVETHWYEHGNAHVPDAAPTPRCLGAFVEGGERFLVLEDLTTRGYDRVVARAQPAEIAAVLGWLAAFHAQHLYDKAEGLWPNGTYWHLQTRPDELAAIEGTRMHRFASLLDARLRCGAFPTVVHGDAKLANFLFSEDGRGVAAVDFQYVGRGAAMKDVAYFVGSCLNGPDCERQEGALLEAYFSALRAHLPAAVDAAALEAEWRSLYPVAWADFERFMMGWSPGHRKRTGYSDATSDRAIDAIGVELLGAARDACRAAGAFIMSNRHRPIEVASKGFESRASDVVTEIDIAAQVIIMERLQRTIDRYDLGVLAEEGTHDDSRLRKHAFWAVDPLDGTQCFIEGRSGFATSIALVSQQGDPVLGVVYDPVNDRMYEAVRGAGVTMNGEPLSVMQPQRRTSKTVWFADRSLTAHPNFEAHASNFEVRFVGGAVMNGIHVLTTPNSVYAKPPKAELGGCAIWDLAAVALMVEEHGGRVQTHEGQRLSMNRAETVYFNDAGFLMSSLDANARVVLARIHGSHGPSLQ
ncbi:MAG: inositol monophosphatase family protein [Myxococcota bacterium]|nr:inositol monophosphatase family protein [Myxococcota bacterium]